MIIALIIVGYLVSVTIAAMLIARNWYDDF